MKINEAFPSAFLKADDLQGREVVVSIASVVMEDVGQGRDKETKLIASFHGKQKKLILNKTNANTIAKLYGDDTDDWANQKITLVAREVEFQGDMVLAIRVSLQKPSGGPAPAKKPAAKAAPAPEPDRSNESDEPPGEGEDTPF